MNRFYRLWFEIIPSDKGKQEGLLNIANEFIPGKDTADITPDNSIVYTGEVLLSGDTESWYCELLEKIEIHDENVQIEAGWKLLEKDDHYYTNIPDGYSNRK